MPTTDLRNHTGQPYHGLGARRDAAVATVDMPCAATRADWFTVDTTTTSRTNKHQRPREYRTG